MIDLLLDIAARTGKEALIYLSMAFGNPYGDKWSPELVLEWTDKLTKSGVEHLSVADTIGVATPDSIATVISSLRKEFPSLDLSLHLHTTPNTWYEKIDAAYKNGCHHFEGVTNGLGGCPMTGYELMGNLDTGHIIEYCKKNNLDVTVDAEKFNKLKHKANQFYAMGNEPDYSNFDYNKEKE
jgi:hydroxymethylglutaryl-CoA lyase